MIRFVLITLVACSSPIKEHLSFGSALPAMAALPAMDPAPADMEEMAAVQMRQYKLARDAGNVRVADEYLRELARLALRDGLLRLEMVYTFTVAGDEDAVHVICDGRLDARVTWPCAEGDRHSLVKYLPAIADLPVLTYDDSQRLATLDSDHALPGLDCLRGGETNPQRLLLPILRRREVGRLPREAEVVIYHRLAEGAPTPLALCLLGRAAEACLDLLASDHSCPMLYTVGDYVAMLSYFERIRYTQDLLKLENDANLFNGNDLADARVDLLTVLCNIHIALANMIMNESLRTYSEYMVVLDNVYAAEKMWPLIKDADTPIASMLLPEIIEFICVPGSCTRICKLGRVGTSRSCGSSCELHVQQAQRSLCRLGGQTDP